VESVAGRKVHIAFGSFALRRSTDCSSGLMTNKKTHRPIPLGKRVNNDFECAQTLALPALRFKE
jgi:hypothetical protein